MKQATPEAKLLHKALLRRGIKCELEADDGYKSVDISIDWAKLDIEIDGKHHIYNSKQLYTDIKRSNYSKEDGYDTIRITNAMIRENVNGIADSIAKVARRRYYEKEEDGNIFEDFGKMITSIFKKF